MLLMLGVGSEPYLLVETSSTSTDCFEFFVINGGWEGKFDSGELTVYAPGGDEVSEQRVKILCDNQDRLRGDYQTVFDNFHNPDYIAPQIKRVEFDLWDDDVPF